MTVYVYYILDMMMEFTNDGLNNSRRTTPKKTWKNKNDDNLNFDKERMFNKQKRQFHSNVCLSLKLFI